MFSYVITYIILAKSTILSYSIFLVTNMQCYMIFTHKITEKDVHLRIPYASNFEVVWSKSPYKRYRIISPPPTVAPIHGPGSIYENSKITSLK